MAKAVATLFRVFVRSFHGRFRALAEDPRAMHVWDRKLRSRGVRPETVLAAIGLATDREWPPTLGEFVALCRESVPSAATALSEAMRWVPGHEFAWSHPAIAASAKDIGHSQLHRMRDRQLRPLWEDVYRQMLARHARGESLEVPAVRALPSEIRTTTPAGAPLSASTAAAIAEARRLLGLRHG